MEYGFNVEIAQKLGVNEAIIIRNFQHWLGKNKANNANFYDGRYWTYNSIGAFCKIFPFWTEHQIRNILKKLTIDGILIKGNFNKNPYDKTIWYSIDENVLNNLLSDDKLTDNNESYNEQIQNKPKSTGTVDLTNFPNRCGKNTKSMCENSQIDAANFQNRCGKFPEPIPCVNTDSKPCENTHTQSVSEKFFQNGDLAAVDTTPNSREVGEFCADYKALKNAEFEPSADDKAAIAKVLAKNGGYGLQKREYWRDVFKKASRGWKIVEKDITRIVPCPLDRVLTDHSRIKANELGLLPPKKDAPKSEIPPEPEIAEDDALTDAALQRARAVVRDIRRMKMPIR